MGESLFGHWTAQRALEDGMGILQMTVGWFMTDNSKQIQEIQKEILTANLMWQPEVVLSTQMSTYGAPQMTSQVPINTSVSENKLPLESLVNSNNNKKIYTSAH